MRPNTFRVFGAVLGLWLAAGGAAAIPGGLPVEEAALIRSVVVNETVVGETLKAIEIPCSPSETNGRACTLDAEFARAIAEANARPGYLQCRALDLEAERCVRRREIKRRVFHRFPAVMFSRPAFSSDGKTAVVYRTRYASENHGQREWVFLTRDGPGKPWTVALERLVDAF